MTLRRLFLGLSVLLLVMPIQARLSVYAQDDEPPDTLVERGEYLVTIAGCIGCHTPLNQNGRPDQLNLLAGGREFDLGPLGTLRSRNLTPDEETGIGLWTDEEIKTAITTGVTPGGHQLFWTMPYPYFNNMVEEDLDAIVAFLRSVRPVENDVGPHPEMVPEEVLPHFTRRIIREPAPDPANTIARGNYLLTAVLACSDCHTPFDPQTGLPQEDLYLAGGQPFEGEWGIVYGGNITPHEEVGIGNWSDDDIKRVLTTGVLPDGRKSVLMPWEDYTVLSDDDLDAIVYYLRVEVDPIDRRVPDAALEDDYVEFVDLPVEPQRGSQRNLLIIAMIVGGLAGLFIAGSLYTSRDRQRNWP